MYPLVQEYSRKSHSRAAAAAAAAVAVVVRTPVSCCSESGFGDDEARLHGLAARGVVLCTVPSVRTRGAQHTGLTGDHSVLGCSCVD